MPVRDQIVGVYKLVSFTRVSNGGRVTFPYGEDAIGRLCYDRAGRMSAQLMGARCTDRPDYIAYFGTYEVDEQAQTVIHHVAASLMREWVGTDLVRHYAFAGSRLTLSATMDDGKGVLVWEREPDDV